MTPPTRASASTAVHLNYNVSEIQSAITAALAPNGAVVTVTGTLADLTATLTISIPAGKKVTWSADYSGSVSGTDGLIKLNGDGEFEVTGGEIKSTAGRVLWVYNNLNISITGGNIETTLDGNKAIHCEGTGTISVTGGTVKSGVDGYTIDTYGSVHIGGTAQIIHTGANNAIHMDGATPSTFTMDGGTVSAGKFNAVYLIAPTNGKVTAIITGGTITNETGNGSAVVYGVGATNSKVLIFRNGGTITPGGTNPGAPLGTDAATTAIAITRTATTTSYTQNSTADLSVLPASATAKWDFVGGVSGITYANGANSGFLPVSGVTVREAGIRVNGAALHTAVADIKNAIENALASGNATVTGSLSDVTETLDITIPEGREVTWQAEYLGIVASGLYQSLIALRGDGAFDVASGGVIDQNSDNSKYTISAYNNVSVTVSGGTVSGNYLAIYAVTGSSPSITVSGGTVFGNNWAINADYATGGSITVSGGTVRAAEGEAISSSSNMNILISGGRVEALGSSEDISSAINTSSTITVTGGVVCAKEGYASQFTGATQTATLSGGFVFGYGTLTTGNSTLLSSAERKQAVLLWRTYNGNSNFTQSGNSVITAWNQAAGATLYAAGSATDLLSSPEGAAVWAIVDGKSGITYTNGENTGFFEVEGVTVKNDIIPPAIEAGSGSINRTSHTAATIGFTTDEAGTAYYLVTERGAEPAPTGAAIKTADNSLGEVAAGAVTNLPVTLTRGDKDIYIVVEDADGNLSNVLKIEADALNKIFVNDPEQANPLTTVAAVNAAITMALGTSDTVTVTGGFDGVPESFNIGIPAGKKVIWQADVIGSTGSDMIYVYAPAANGGVFEVAGARVVQNGSASAIGANNVSIVVSGDAVITANNAAAILLNGNFAATLEVTGGTITANNGSIILLNGENKTAIISGGTISNSSNANAVIHANANNTAVLINGGTVTANGGADRFGIAEGKNAIFIEKTGTASTFVANTSAALSVTPSGGTAWAEWKKQDGKSGVSYENGSNTGFIETPGITIEEYFAVSSSTERFGTLIAAAANVNNGDTITLLQNLTVSSAIVLGVNKTYTIDLNGKTLTSSTTSTFLSIFAGTVTIKNGNVTGGIGVVNGGELIVESGAYSGYNNAIYSGMGGKVTIISGTFSCTDDESGNGCLFEEEGEILLATGSIADVGNWKNSATSVTVTRQAGISVNGGEGLYIVTDINAAITAALAESDTVTVTGELSNVTEQFRFNISAGKRVIWKAAVSGSTSTDIIYVFPLYVGSGGVLEVAGGKVIQNGVDCAITAYSTSVVVSGDAVISNTTGPAAIYLNGADAATLEITGGTITSNTGNAIRLVGTNKTAIISGGTISNSNSSSSNPQSVIAANADNNVVLINGGTVTANGTGGRFAIAEGKNGIFIEKTGTTTSFVTGTSADLEVTPVEATAKWARQDGKSGVSYVNGTNIGFIETPGITVYENELYVNGGEALTTVAATSAAITAALADNDVVTVTGSLFGVTAYFSINIPEGKKVIWKADVSGSTVNDPLIYAEGSGLFEVAGGKVIQNGTGNTILADNANMVVSGNAEIAANSGHAIYLNDNAATLLEVSGGTITSEDRNAIYLGGENKTVIISGGEVSSSSNTNAVIYTYGDNNVVLVSGGAVTATGTGGKFGVTDDTNGVFIEKTGTETEYLAGTSDDLTVTPAEATATWAKQDGKNGVSYVNGTNSGFIEVPGITVYENELYVNGGEALTTVAATNAAITAALADNDTETVTVTGSYLGVEERFYVNIPAGKKVIWQADVSGNTVGGYIIYVYGTGAFEVAGGRVVQNGSGAAIEANNVSIVVSEDAVITANSGRAIMLYGNNATTLEVTGGTITANITNAIYLYGGNTTVIISGGEVSSSGALPVIFSYGTNNAVLVNGGAVTTTGTGGKFGINAGTNGVFIEKTGAGTEYLAGSSDDLGINSAGTAKWARRSSKNGVSYVNGTNSGFIEVPGITVTGFENFAISNSTERYETLADAVEAVENNGTITMLNDVTVSSSLEFELYADKTYTIDLGGKTLTGSGGYALYIDAGTVTVKNGSVSGSITVENSSELIVESGAYSGESRAIYCESSGKVTIISGDFSYTNETSSNGCLNGSIRLAQGSAPNVYPWKNHVSAKAVTVTTGHTPENFAVSGSEVKYNTLVEAAEAVENNGTITMLKNVSVDMYDNTLNTDKTYTLDLGGKTLSTYGGNFGLFALQVEAGTVTVKNGSVTARVDVNGGELTVESGAYSGTSIAIACYGGKVTLISGTFTSTNPSYGCLMEYGGEIVLAPGSTADVNPWKNTAGVMAVTVTATENFAVSNSTTKYATLAEAAAAVEANGTITMLNDVTVASGNLSQVTLDVVKTYTIDFDNKTLTRLGWETLVVDTGTVTLRNGNLTAAIFVYGGNLIVESGSYSGQNEAIDLRNGTVTIISGAFTGTLDGDKNGCLEGAIRLAPGSAADVFPWKNHANATAVTITTGHTVSAPEENFAVSNSPTKYETLVEAAEAVENNGTITMLNNVTTDMYDVRLRTDKTYTIDLDGYALGGYPLSSLTNISLMVDTGTVTVKNGSLTAAVGMYGGELTLKNVSCSTSDNDELAAIFCNGGKATLLSSTVTGTVTVNDGELTVESSACNGELAAIYCTGGKVTIISGSFSNTDDSNGLGCIIEDGGEIVLASGSTADVNPWKNTAGVMAVEVFANKLYVNGGEALTTVEDVNAAIEAALEDNDVVTVTGSYLGVAEMFYFIFPEGKKVVWEASVSGSTAGGYIIFAEGSGVFEVAGGKVIQNGTGNAIFTNMNTVVSGNAEIAANSGIAIMLTGDNATTLKVTGGTITANTRNAISLNGGNMTVIISGGEVSSSSNTNAVIYAYGDNNAVLVSGGTVTATGTGGKFGITDDNNSVFIEKTGEEMVFAVGSTDDLEVTPAEATAAWARQGGKSGVSYVNGGNSGFIEVAGVTVTTPVTLTLAKGRNWYLSSPVVAAKANTAFAAAGFVEYYDEPRTTPYSASDQTIDGWVNIAGSANTLVPGKGYVVYADGEGEVTYTFIGEPNTGDVEVPLTRTADVTKEGFNLVGNPYLSYIDWNAVSSVNGDIVEPTIWYRTKTEAYQFYTYNSESGLSDPVLEEYSLQYIPPMQGFWVRAANAGTFKFTEGAKVSNETAGADNGNLLRQATGNQRPLVRLQLADGGKTDRAVIFADKNAKDGFDRYDSEKCSVRMRRFIQ
ncbi:hypothetical protein FACS189426_09530 [Bacteroidia bacterium]|nr:hypothetical protein FACS189426_09530 [Bacteroidia bacterium]